MPRTKVIFYQDENGKAPVYEWLKALRKEDLKGWVQCRTRIFQLESIGHELRRPAADYLRDDIRELRAKHGNVQYRILYFFHGRNIAILAHAMIKKNSAVADADIERAIQRRDAFKVNPDAHTFVGDDQND